MLDRHRLVAIVWIAVTLASLGAAGVIALDTIRTVVSLHSALPWLDDWNSPNLYRYWAEGSLTAIEALSSQFGEHRLLVPRLVFLADDLFLRGQGWLELSAILLVQAAHAALFMSILARAARGRGRWAVAALVVAMMFSLKQAANFSSSFQLQFVGVYAAATLAFVLFGRAVARSEAGLPSGRALAASLTAAAIATFCMANGLICGLVLVGLALAARLSAGAWARPDRPASPAAPQDGSGDRATARPRLSIAGVGVVALGWLVLVALYADGYHAAPGHAPLSEALRRPVPLLAYAASYLGNLAGEANPRGAALLGGVGMVATMGAAILVLRRRVEPGASFALLGGMLFCVASAFVTGLGRLNFGVVHALEERYVTGSVTFWSAQLCFWWIAAPARLPRAAMAAIAIWLAVVLVGAQATAKPALYVRKFDLDIAEIQLLLGLDDPAAIRRVAWDDADVREDVPILRAAAISIFGGPDADLVGRPFSRMGRIADPETCTGGIGAASSDTRLGPNGVRVHGRGYDTAQRRRLRRILLVDGSGRVAGLATSGVPGGDLHDWRGFAVAPAGSALTAYGVLDAGTFCRLGEPQAVAGE